MSNEATKEFVMKFKSASTTDYTLYKAANHFFVKWFEYGEEYHLPYYSDTVHNFIKQGTWKQIPNTIEDMEVGDYLENTGNTTDEFTKNGIYQIKEVTNNPSWPFVLLNNEGGDEYVTPNLWKFHKKAYVEFFMKDKIAPEVQSYKEKEMTKFKNMKFRVENPEHSELIQKELFKLGYDWEMDSYKGKVMFTESPWMQTDEEGNLTRGFTDPNEDEGYNKYTEYKIIPEKYALVEAKEMVEVDFLEVEGYKVERSKLVDFLKSQQGE